jgi:hypothetical protein
VAPEHPGELAQALSDYLQQRPVPAEMEASESWGGIAVRTRELYERVLAGAGAAVGVAEQAPVASGQPLK